MKVLITMLTALLFAGRAAPEAPPAEPAARIVVTDEGAFVCIAPGFEQGEQWPAVCAEVGVWRRCAESATQLQCAPDPRRPA